MRLLRDLRGNAWTYLNSEYLHRREIYYLCSVSLIFSIYYYFPQASVFPNLQSSYLDFIIRERNILFKLLCYHWNSKIHYPQINVLMCYYIIVLPDLVQLSRPYKLFKKVCLGLHVLMPLLFWPQIGLMNFVFTGTLELLYWKCRGAWVGSVDFYSWG